MKLSIKGVAVTTGIMWSICVGWCVLMKLVGIGDTPYNFFDEFYLGWLAPTVGGLVIGVVLGFVDGFVGGAIFSWIYNKIAK